MSPEQKYLWRRRDVLEYGGITDYELRKLTGAGILVAVTVRENGRAYFKRVDVLRVLEGESVKCQGEGEKEVSPCSRARTRTLQGAHRGKKEKHGSRTR